MRKYVCASPDFAWHPRGCRHPVVTSHDRAGAEGQRTKAQCNAQVTEWLMVADCKSAALRSYGGSNPPLCTSLEQSALSSQHSALQHYRLKRSETLECAAIEFRADVAQLVEHSLGKGEVTGSIP